MPLIFFHLLLLPPPLPLLFSSLSHPLLHSLPVSHADLFSLISVAAISLFPSLLLGSVVSSTFLCLFIASIIFPLLLYALLLDSVSTCLGILKEQLFIIFILLLLTPPIKKILGSFLAS